MSELPSTPCLPVNSTLTSLLLTWAAQAELPGLPGLSPRVAQPHGPPCKAPSARFVNRTTQGFRTRSHLPCPQSPAGHCLPRCLAAAEPGWQHVQPCSRAPWVKGTFAGTLPGGFPGRVHAPCQRADLRPFWNLCQQRRRDLRGQGLRPEGRAPLPVGKQALLAPARGLGEAGHSGPGPGPGGCPETSSLTEEGCALALP